MIARRQRGALSVAFAALLLFLLGAAVIASLQLGGSSVQDGRSSEEQTAALFLAESGIERAQGVIAASMDDFDNAAQYCAGLADGKTYAMGRGQMQILSAQPSPQPCTAGVPTGACCTLLASGQVQDQQRLLQARISTEFKQGVEGYGSTTSPALVMETRQNGAAAFTNLAYRAKDPIDAQANARVGSCTNTAGVCRIGPDYTEPDGWDLPRTGTNNVSSSAVYAAVPLQGDYTIDVAFINNARRPAARNYVQTGVLLYPPVGTEVSFLGHFASANDTSSTSGVSGSVGTWTCMRGSSTVSQWARAGGADTLLYGFASWPIQIVTRLGGVSFGAQPMNRVVNLVGTRGDNLYSQIWYTHNPAYLPVTAQPVAGDSSKYYNPAGDTAPPLSTASSGASFTATMGAAFTAGVSAGVLVLESSVGESEVLLPGDEVYLGSTRLGELGALLDGQPGQAGARYAYSGTALAAGSAVLTRSRVLNVVSEPAAGALSAGDTIQTTAITPVTLGRLESVAGVSGALRFRLATPQRLARSAGNLRSLNIVVLDTNTVLGPWTRDLTGTALAVYDPPAGTGRFTASGFQGSISGLELQVTSAGTVLHVGDAIAGAGVKPLTRITRVIDEAAQRYEVCSGPAGVACQSQEVGSTASPVALVARAAIKPNHATAALVSSLTAGSFSVSRPPTLPLAAARVCGGLCALMHNLNGDRASTFQLAGITAGDDWASGMTCLSGVDPFRLRVLGSLVVKRVAWAEVIR